MISTILKPKTCAHCPQVFMPRSAFQTVCSPKCLLKQVNRQEREKKAKAKSERAADRAKRADQETIPQLIKRADKAFQEYIRERDRKAGHACISSGRPLDWSGNKVDAGHYRSKGAASHLRYDEDNCHAQTKHENRDKAGNAVEYRMHLIKRIGLERVERLESSNEAIKWSRDVLRQIIVIYRAKARALRKERA